MRTNNVLFYTSDAMKYSLLVEEFQGEVDIRGTNVDSCIVDGYSLVIPVTSQGIPSFYTPSDILGHVPTGFFLNVVFENGMRYPYSTDLGYITVVTTPDAPYPALVLVTMRRGGELLRYLDVAFIMATIRALVKQRPDMRFAIPFLAPNDERLDENTIRWIAKSIVSGWRLGGELTPEEENAQQSLFSEGQQ